MIQSTIDVFGKELSFFIVGLSITILIILLAINSIYRRFRLLESETQLLKKDIQVISEELEVLVKAKTTSVE